MSLANGVLSAKAKAMFGKRLRPEDYQTMMQKKNVSEVASYLKQDTYFSTILQGINEQGIHRGQLESLIRMDLFQRFSSLMRYVDHRRAKFYRYGVMDQEIVQILACIRSLSTEDKLSFIVNVPTHLERLTLFKMEELSMVKSYADLLDVVKGTMYEAILKKFQVEDIKNFDFNACEIELRKKYSEAITDLINHGFHGQARKAVQDMFTTRDELLNFQKIYRMKKYFNYGPDRIKNMIEIKRAHLSKEEMNNLIEKVDADDMFEWLRKTSYGKYIDDQQFLYIEYHIKKILYAMDRKQMTFSTNPDLVVLAYILMSEVEIQNIVDIIEGVRYRMPPDKVARYLIY